MENVGKLTFNETKCTNITMCPNSKWESKFYAISTGPF